MTNALTINGISVKQDADGRYCLNDLHKAAGGERRHDTREFLDRDATQELVDELSRKMTGNPVNKARGRNGGTYVVKQLVYAYAMWISPKFNLEVIEFFDRGATQGVAVHKNAAESVLDDPLSYMEEILAQAKQLKAERDRLAAENAVMFVQNKVMHDELNLLTVDEYRALTHRYFNHGYKVKLGQAAARVLREQGQEPDQQKRTVRIRGEERIVTVNVYPRAALEQAERELAA